MIGTDRASRSTTRPTETRRARAQRVETRHDDLRLHDVLHPRQVLFGHRTHDVDAVQGDDAEQDLALFDRGTGRGDRLGNHARDGRAHDHALAGAPRSPRRCD